MAITGSNFIGHERAASGRKTFNAFNPAENKQLPEAFHQATPEELNLAVTKAREAFELFRDITPGGRAIFLRAIASEIADAGDELITRCVAESGLPAARITGERGRTIGQLQMFADLLDEGWWADARIDTADPGRLPLPKADIRRMLIPIGPVAVFGSSNFPLAFSTAGGDTASALAAGCPVVVKAHSSHPGTNALVAEAIIRAAIKTGMPDGVFSSLYLSHEHVTDLVKHPYIKAVGFTGSRKVGMMLFDAACRRDEPIPVFAEMSAVNPVVLTDSAISKRGKQIAKGLADSVTLGVGQFCTNPGVVLVPRGSSTTAFLDELAAVISAAPAGTMLNRQICQSYSAAVNAMKKEKGVEILGHSSHAANAGKNQAQPVIFTVSGDAFLENKSLSQEIFGPASTIVIYETEEELLQLLEGMEGQLTATIHAEEEDAALVRKVTRVASEKAGRIIMNGFPTGVEVCHSMQHGGPFPSTTDGRTTSVGTAAIYRFLRPVAFQNMPDTLLPEPLQNSNPLNVLRLVNGRWTSDPIS